MGWRGKLADRLILLMVNSAMPQPTWDCEAITIAMGILERAIGEFHLNSTDRDESGIQSKRLTRGIPSCGGVVPQDEEASSGKDAPVRYGINRSV